MGFACWSGGGVATALFQGVAYRTKKIACSYFVHWHVLWSFISLAARCFILVETWFWHVFDFEFYRKYTVQIIENSILRLKSFSTCKCHLLWMELFFHVQDCGQVTLGGVSSILNCKALEDVLLRHTVSMKNFVARFLFWRCMLVPLSSLISWRVDCLYSLWELRTAG